MLKLEENNYVRCVNCWQLHATNKSILDHWNNGACLYYCTICGKSFHDNIKDLKPHFETEHGIKYRTMFLPKPDQIRKVEPVKKPDPPKQQSMQVNSMKSDLIGKPVPAPKANKKIVIKPEPSYRELGEFRCEPCNRTFIHRKAYRAHYTLSHKKKHYQLNGNSAMEESQQQIDDQTINQMVVVNKTTKLSKNQKKKLKKRTNEAVMKTVIRKPPKKQISVGISSNQPPPPTRKLAEPMEIGETLVQCSTTSTTATAQSSQELQVSQDQTVSTTYLASSTYNDSSDIQIKPEPEPEPIEEFSINYPEVPVQSCNGWIQSPPQLQPQPQPQPQLQPQPLQQLQMMSPPLPPPPPLQQCTYDAWNHNVVDPYIDTSPRLKVKDLTEMQVPPRRYPIESQGYQQNSVHKDQTMIMPNQNMIGLQIQNVQSYQPVQPQPYVDYSCMNSMSSSINMPEHGMCTTNLYEMHISPPQPVQSTQLINPVFLLPSNPTHAVQEYHY